MKEGFCTAKYHTAPVFGIINTSFNEKTAPLYMYHTSEGDQLANLVTHSFTAYKKRPTHIELGRLECVLPFNFIGCIVYLKRNRFY